MYMCIYVHVSIIHRWRDIKRDIENKVLYILEQNENTFWKWFAHGDTQGESAASVRMKGELKTEIYQSGK